ncbi:MAG: PTS sugar transporter subunit IIA, partial [Spirochaetales bacterium]|nr:PTS sugar transporter subunit IIA [Spirochaetales bacterium]
MKLGSLISKDFIITGSGCKSVMEAVETLTKHFEKQVKLPCSIEEVKKVVLEREQLGGTILPPGIAIPHGRLEGFEDILAGIWVPDKPLVTDEGDVKILFFFITSKSGSPLYLPVLSCLGTYFGNEEFLDSLMGQSPAQIHDKLNTMELKKEITVED